MRIFLGILLFVAVSIASQGVSSSKKKRVYTVQLFCLSHSHNKNNIIQKIPYKLWDKIHFHQVKNQTVGCYSQALTYKKILHDLKKVKKFGYKDAYIISTTKWYMPRKRKNIISKYVISKMIAKANKAYKKGDDTQVVMYYKMLLAAGVKNDKIKSNLCFLYGKKGAWAEAEDIIKSSKYRSKLIASYANGAVRTSQENFYNDLKEYIMMDRSGHLALLTGYYFEQRRDIQNAGKFYKMAYQKNRNDVYNRYAYARYLDLIGQNQEAVEIYKKIYTAIDEETQLHQVLKLRLK